MAGSGTQVSIREFSRAQVELGHDEKKTWGHPFYSSRQPAKGLLSRPHPPSFGATASK